MRISYFRLIMTAVQLWTTSAAFPRFSSTRPGDCPILRPEQVGVCVQECNQDRDCLVASHKCCSNGCGMVCRKSADLGKQKAEVSPAANDLEAIGLDEEFLEKLLNTRLTNLEHDEEYLKQPDSLQGHSDVDKVLPEKELRADNSRKQQSHLRRGPQGLNKEYVEANEQQKSIQHHKDEEKEPHGNHAEDVEDLVEHTDINPSTSIPTLPTPAHRVQIHQDAVAAQPSEPESLHKLVFIVIVAACSVAAVAGISAAGVCWYRLHKSAKAAEDVEYPAYGVTGPKLERSGSGGDRKLAQSAQMYHYQHQKQQMIAMEKANGEMKQGENSECESEEENEEGDYTVYECPGLASTGEMTVKNPLFADETPTPVAPKQ